MKLRKLEKEYIDKKMIDEVNWCKKHKEDRSEKVLNDLFDYSSVQHNKLVAFDKKTFKLSQKISKKDEGISEEDAFDKLANERKSLREILVINVEEKIQKRKNQLKKKKENLETQIKKSIRYLEGKTDVRPLWYYGKMLLRRRGATQLLNGLYKTLNDNKLMVVIFVIAIIAGLSRPVFFSSRNITVNILKNNVTVGIMALGMTFVILTGGIDLSVGSMLGFSGIYSMGFLLGGMPTLLAFIIGILLALILGLVQGLLVSYVKLPPFIVTLVGLLSIRGIVYIYAKGQPKTDIGNTFFEFINTETFIGLPFSVWILFILMFIGMFVLKYTVFGRNIYSVGGNLEAAELSGINTKRVLTIAYCISALTAGIGSMFLAAQISSVGPTAGNAYELDVIAAVVLGGTSLTGGKGGVGKTVLGWLVISILGNALIILGYDSNYQLVFKGIVILFAVILDKNLNIKAKIMKLVNKYR